MISVNWFAVKQDKLFPRPSFRSLSLNFLFRKIRYKEISRFFSHFRYPASLPEDIALDLGIEIPKSLNFQKFLEELASPHIRLKKIYKFMPQEEAELAFNSALKKESFKSTTLFSYFFPEGWVVITLYFDEEKQLRRLHVFCPSNLSSKEEFDIRILPRHSINNILEAWAIIQR